MSSEFVGQKPEEITARIIVAIKKIWKKHTTPILIMECIGYSNVASDMKSEEEIQKANNASRQVFEQIQKEGIPNVYYLTREELSLPIDSGTVRHAYVYRSE